MDKKTLFIAFNLVLIILGCHAYEKKIENKQYLHKNEILPFINGIFGNKFVMKRAVFIKQDSISLNTDSLKIYSYNLIYIGKGYDGSYRIYSNKINDHVKNEIRQNSIQIIAIDDIIVHNKKGQKRKLKWNLSFYLID